MNVLCSMPRIILNANYCSIPFMYFSALKMASSDSEDYHSLRDFDILKESDICFCQESLGI